MSDMFNAKGDYYCEFCSKYCHSLNSLKQHQTRCRLNPKRINVITDGFNNNRVYKKGKHPWNHGLTKDIDNRIAQASEKTSSTLKGRPGRKQSASTKQKLSEIAIQRKLGGFNMRKKGIVYNDTKLDSSYEVTLAKSLDENNIKWTRCSRFPYITPQGELHYYTPDFYLPDYDIYLDPKNDFLIENVNPSLGYKDVDKIDWVASQNNIRIIILHKDQLDWNIIRELI